MQNPENLSLTGVEASAIPIGGRTDIGIAGAPGVGKRYRVWAYAISFIHSAAAANVMSKPLIVPGHIAISATDRSDRMDFPGGMLWPINTGLTASFWSSAATTINAYFLVTVEEA